MPRSAILRPMRVSSRVAAGPPRRVSGAGASAAPFRLRHSFSARVRCGDSFGLGNESKLRVL